MVNHELKDKDDQALFTKIQANFSTKNLKLQVTALLFINHWNQGGICDFRGEGVDAYVRHVEGYFFDPPRNFSKIRWGVITKRCGGGKPQSPDKYHTALRTL